MGEKPIKLSAERRWWLAKWERDGWSIGDPMRHAVKKWRQHTQALFRAGLLESDRPDDPIAAMYRITPAGRAILSNPGASNE